MADDVLARSLQRCQLESIAFPVESIEQQEGRAVVEHERWKGDGAELTDTGRRASRGKVTAIFLRGLPGWSDDLYPDTFTELRQLLATRGDRDLRLAHPLLGTFLVRVPSWEPRVEATTRNGARISFDWLEQRASIVGVSAALVPPLDIADALDNAAAAADASLARLGILTTLARAAQTVRRAIGRALSPVGEVQGAIAAMRAQLKSATRLVSLQPLTAISRSLVHAGRAAVAQCQGAVARVEAQVNSPVGLPRTYTAPRTMTVAEVSAAVYGTPRRASDVRTVNGLASDTVPAGTELRIP